MSSSPQLVELIDLALDVFQNSTQHVFALFFLAQGDLQVLQQPDVVLFVLLYGFLLSLNEFPLILDKLVTLLLEGPLHDYFSLDELLVQQVLR